MKSTRLIGAICIIAGLVLMMYGIIGLRIQYKTSKKELPVVGEQYYHVDKDNPFEQDTIKIIITDVRTNRNGEIWVEYHHYYSKDGSIIEEPCTKDWKFIENLFEKYD
jgi:uncharacterized membrane protein